MSYPLWQINSSVYHELSPQRLTDAVALKGFIHTEGLKTRVDSDGSVSVTQDLASVVDILGGAETEGNLRTLQQYLGNMRNLMTYTVRAQFAAGIAPFVQSGNRSVESGLRNLNLGVVHMLQFMKSFVGKDIKSPIRFLPLGSNTVDHGRDPDLIYTEEQTGTYHTLQTLGENQAWAAWSTYLEDTPSLRRYIRYVDFLAQRYGMRLVYCPKQFNHMDELASPARPEWQQQGRSVVRRVQTGRYTVLLVSLAFDYGMFRDLTVVESTSQPGQRPRQASQMDYGPIFVDNLPGITKVINTMGAFPTCKIYYKDYRTSTRSSQAAPSS
jgi:hypothetical protein